MLCLYRPIVCTSDLVQNLEFTLAPHKLRNAAQGWWTLLFFSVLVMSESADQTEDEETEHDKRKRQLLLQDPVHTVNLKDYVQQTLVKCQSVYGQTVFSQLMETVDPDVLQQLQDFVHLWHTRNIQWKRGCDCLICPEQARWFLITLHSLPNGIGENNVWRACLRTCDTLVLCFFSFILRTVLRSSVLPHYSVVSSHF